MVGIWLDTLTPSMTTMYVNVLVVVDVDISLKSEFSWLTATQ